MIEFTPEERRAIRMLIALLALGAVHDLWTAARGRDAPASGLVMARAGATGSNAGGGAQAADSAAEPPARAARDGDAGGIVDINRAGPDELDALPGIGPVLSRRILDFRSAHGPFRSVDDLRAVRGVGPRLLERLRPRIRAGGASEGR